MVRSAPGRLASGATTTEDQPMIFIIAKFRIRPEHADCPHGNTEGA